jgi:hypothetical protein
MDWRSPNVERGACASRRLVGLQFAKFEAQELGLIPERKDMPSRGQVIERTVALAGGTQAGPDAPEAFKRSVAE